MSPKRWLALLDITFVDGTIVRLANHQDDVIWNGNTYMKAAFQPDTQSQKSGGELPQTRLSISNVGRLIQGYLQQYRGAVDAVVDISILPEDELSTGRPAYISVRYQVMEASADEKVVTFTLGAPNPLGLMVPGKLYLSQVCPKIFNTPAMQAALDPRGAECRYSGSLLTCDLTLEGRNGCRVHQNVLNFGGFPGMDSAGFRNANLQ